RTTSRRWWSTWSKARGSGTSSRSSQLRSTRVGTGASRATRSATPGASTLPRWLRRVVALTKEKCSAHDRCQRLEERSVAFVGQRLASQSHRDPPDRGDFVARCAPACRRDACSVAHRSRAPLFRRAFSKGANDATSEAGEVDPPPAPDLVRRLLDDSGDRPSLGEHCEDYQLSPSRGGAPSGSNLC